MSNKWSTQQKTILFGSLATVAVSFLMTFVVTPWLSKDPNDSIKHVINLIVFLLSLALGSLITLTLIILERNEKVDAKFESLSREFHSAILENNSFTYIGNFDAVLSHLEGCISDLDYVYNTRISTNEKSDSSIDVTHKDRIIELIKNCTDKGIQWYDVISEKGVERVEAIRNAIGRKNLYHSYQISSEFPLPNFTCLYFKKGSRPAEVLFGFWYNQIDDEVEAFLSTHEQLTERYYYFHRVLRQHYANPCK